jgi:flavodoxin
MLLIHDSQVDTSDEITQKITACFNDAVVKDTSSVSALDFENHDVLFINATSICRIEHPMKFQNFLDKLKEIDFSTKKVAFFGTGECETSPGIKTKKMRSIQWLIHRNQGKRKQ